MSHKAGSICAVSGCKNYKSQKDSKSFFRMPRDLQRLKKWIEACKRSDLVSLLEVKDADYFNKNYVVCSDHFDEKCFRNKDLYSQGLLPNSIPTLALCDVTKVPLKRKSQCEKSVMECSIRNMTTSAVELKSPEENKIKHTEYVQQKKMKGESNVVRQIKEEIIKKLTSSYQQSPPPVCSSTSGQSIGATQSKSSLYPCHDCKQNIVHARFACVQCESYDVCMWCAASYVHEDHYLLRLPKHSTQAETKVVLQAVRAQLKPLLPDKIKQKSIRKGEDTIGESEDTIGESEDTIRENEDSIKWKVDTLKVEVETIGESADLVEFEMTIKDEPIGVNQLTQDVQVDYSPNVEAQCPAEDVCKVKSDPPIHDAYGKAYILKFKRRTVFTQWSHGSGSLKQRRRKLLRTLHNWLPKSTPVDITKLETCVNNLCEKFETYEQEARGDSSAILNKYSEWFGVEEMVIVSIATR